MIVAVCSSCIPARMQSPMYVKLTILFVTVVCHSNFDAVISRVRSFIMSLSLVTALSSSRWVASCEQCTFN
jgi:hypothetical protein